MLGYPKRRQDTFKLHLNQIKDGNKSREQKKVINNINKFCDTRRNTVDLFDDFAIVASEAGYKAIKGTGIKINSSKITNSTCITTSN